MEIYAMTNTHEKWEITAAFAEKCSWRAGKLLSVKMRNGYFKGWERVFAAFANGKPVGFCTFTEKDTLPPKYLYKPFIGFVYVDEYHRGQRISGKMIEKVRHYARINGFGRIYDCHQTITLMESYNYFII